MIEHFDENNGKSFSESFASLCSDEQDSVRLLMVSSIPMMSSFVDLISTFEHLCADQSWRVRYMCADKYEELQAAFLNTISEEKRAMLFKSFLADSENEVRAAAATRLETVSKNFSKQTIIDVIIPELEKMKADDSQAVRGFIVISFYL